MPTTKDKFLEYLKSDSPDNSGKPGSYVIAIDVIGEVLFKDTVLKSIDVWRFINEKNINNIYQLKKYSA